MMTIATILNKFDADDLYIMKNIWNVVHPDVQITTGMVPFVNAESMFRACQGYLVFTIPLPKDFKRLVERCKKKLKKGLRQHGYPIPCNFIFKNVDIGKGSFTIISGESFITHLGPDRIAL